MGPSATCEAVVPWDLPREEPANAARRATAPTSPR